MKKQTIARYVKYCKLSSLYNLIKVRKEKPKKRDVIEDNRLQPLEPKKVAFPKLRNNLRYTRILQKIKEETHQNKEVIHEEKALEKLILYFIKKGKKSKLEKITRLFFYKQKTKSKNLIKAAEVSLQKSIPFIRLLIKKRKRRRPRYAVGVLTSFKKKQKKAILFITKGLREKKKSFFLKDLAKQINTISIEKKNMIAAVSTMHSLAKRYGPYTWRWGSFWGGIHRQKSKISKTLAQLSKEKAVLKKKGVFFNRKNKERAMWYKRKEKAMLLYKHKDNVKFFKQKHKEREKKNFIWFRKKWSVWREKRRSKRRLKKGRFYERLSRKFKAFKAQAKQFKQHKRLINVLKKRKKVKKVSNLSSCERKSKVPFTRRKLPIICLTNGFKKFPNLKRSSLKIKIK